MNSHESTNPKIGRIKEDDRGTFSLEYDNTLGKKNTMRLDAATYEAAIREAQVFLEVNDQGLDDHGAHWDIE